MTDAYERGRLEETLRLIRSEIPSDRTMSYLSRETIWEKLDRIDKLARDALVSPNRVLSPSGETAPLCSICREHHPSDDRHPCE